MTYILILYFVWWNLTNFIKFDTPCIVETAQLGQIENILVLEPLKLVWVRPMLCESWEPRIWFDFACCTLDNRTSLHRYTRLSPLFFAVTLAAVTVVPSLIALDEHMHCLLKLASLDYVLQRVCWVNTRTPVLASFEGNLQTTRKLSASACLICNMYTGKSFEGPGSHSASGRRDLPCRQSKPIFTPETKTSWFFQFKGTTRSILT